MRIGISVVTHTGQNIWQNGLGQNLIFLVELFQCLPFVESVFLIDVGDQRTLPPQVDMTARDLRVMTLREATDEADVIVEMGGALEVKWLDLMRARGKKVVFYCCGQPFVGLAEAAVFEKPSHFQRPDRCDEVWHFSKDATYAPLLRVLQRCDVFEVPYIWHPQFIERRTREVAEKGLHYGYAAIDRESSDTPAGFRVAIFEPNISVVKSSSIPMLVCDEAQRSRPGSVREMHVLNTLHMKDHPTMLYFANSLDLVRQHKATFHGRHDVAGFMVQHANAVVAHQWQNDQNYSYLDVLYGGYPLIHNSPWLKDAGYYYPDFDIQQGRAQLLHAIDAHDAQLDDYRARAKRVFDSVDPFAPHILEAYAGRLQHLCRDARFVTRASRP